MAMWLYMAIGSNHLTLCEAMSSTPSSAGLKNQDLVKDMESVEEGHK
jgi:hypothetical protein